MNGLLVYNVASPASAPRLAPALVLAAAAILLTAQLPARLVPAQLPSALAGAGDADRTQQRADEAYAQLPLSFVPNGGQTDPDVRYTSQAGGVSFWFTSTEAVYSFAGKDEGVTLRLAFLGGNPAPAIEGTAALPGKVNYLLGNDPSAWKTGLPTYGELVYRELWPGIDLAFRGQAGTLSYEFRVAPGADPSDIRLQYRGPDSVVLGAAGDLLLSTAFGTISDAAPVAHQMVGGQRVPVESGYQLAGADYGFELAGYDRSRALVIGSGHDSPYPLVINPGLVYSSYLGGPGTSNFFCECGRSIAVDAQVHAFISGQALEGFPTTAGAFQEDIGGTGKGASGVDAFVAEFDPGASGSGSLLYATYLGGSETDASPSIAVRDNGNVIVGIGTNSVDFPVTATAFQTVLPGGGFDAAIVELDLSASGSDVLVYSSYLGGSRFDGGPAVAVGAGSQAVARLRTRSKDFPITADAFQTVYGGGDLDAAVAVLDTSASGAASLVYSTYLGGSGSDGATTGGLAVDGQGHVFLADTTDSGDFPVTSGAYQATKSGGFDAYVAELDPAVPGSNGLLYSTYLGGAGTDAAPALALGAASHVVVSGRTSSTDLPITGSAFQATYGGGSSDSFVAELDPAVSGAVGLVYSTYLGGSGTDVGEGLAVDGDGHPVAVGTTSSANFPVTRAAFLRSFGGSRDAFVAELNPAAAGKRSLVYSSYLGGSSSDRGVGVAVDDLGRGYVTGDTTSTNFPVTGAAFQSTFAGFTDAFFTVFPPN